MRSGFIGEQHLLQFQYQWAGTQLINTQILCVPDQIDTPQRQLGTIILPPDPVSILNARPEPYAVEEQTFLISQAGVQLYAQNGSALLGDNLQGTTNAGTYPG